MTKLSRSPNFSSRINKASHLEHFAPIVIFSIYSIELELHDRKVCFALLCLGLTKIDLPFLENLRSNWVVIIGLELLSLAFPGLGLGSCYVTSLCLCHPCHYYGYLNPTSMENRIWGDWIENLPVRCWQFKAFVQCDVESLWLVIIPKSKDRFME
jgi:hypothetical protein